MGVSIVHLLLEVVVHLTTEGVSEGGGKVAGANSLYVKLYTAAGKFGGMMKCSVSSLC